MKQATKRLPAFVQAAAMMLSLAPAGTGQFDGSITQKGNRTAPPHRLRFIPAYVGFICVSAAVNALFVRRRRAFVHYAEKSVQK